MPSSTNPFGIADARLPGFCGQRLSREDWDVLVEIVDSCGLSRWLLASTICENLDWLRPNGNPKTRECFEFLGELAKLEVIKLPDVEPRKPQARVRIEHTDAGQERQIREGTLGEVAPVTLELVKDSPQRTVWRELVDRHHYLGDAVPYGAQLRYLIWISTSSRELAGCFQFSSPAWKLEARDRWVGWSDDARRTNLQKIVNNSRFLILPWFRIKGLASHALSRASRVLPDDWEEAYGIRPVLLETFVETDRFDGTCYRAANWTVIGQTAGRGRQDRTNRAAEPTKTYLARPLVSDFRRHLGVQGA